MGNVIYNTTIGTIEHISDRYIRLYIRLYDIHSIVIYCT